MDRTRPERVDDGSGPSAATRNRIGPPSCGGRELQIGAAVGHGVTALAAFDDALVRIGVANLNVIRLSSVIPPGSLVVRRPDGVRLPPCGWGDRLYAVYACQTAEPRGDGAWAGVGWVQDGSGRGLFVEHEAPTEDQVEADISASLSQLVAARESSFERQGRVVVGGRSGDRWACALVLCAYATEPWAWSL